MSLIAYGLIALAVMGAIGTGVYKVKQWGGNEVRAEWSQANEKARKEEAERASLAAAELEKARAEKKIVYRKITETVDRYIDRPVYHNACFDADGLRDANRALLGTLSDPAKPDSGVPATKPPG